MEIEQLKRLLADASQQNLAASCLLALETGNYFFYHRIDPMPLHYLRSVYGVRAEINQRNNGTVQGFETLLPALADFRDERLSIHAIETSVEWFWVFTNTETTEIIGLLGDHSPRLFQYNIEHGLIPRTS
jgi:hypothetical protein